MSDNQLPEDLAMLLLGIQQIHRMMSIGLWTYLTDTDNEGQIKLHEGCAALGQHGKLRKVRDESATGGGVLWAPTTSGQ